MTDETETEDGELPHPRETGVLFGHGEAEQALLSAYRSGRIPHAILIGGPRGIGKATLAYRMAKFVLVHPDPTAPEVTAAQDLSVPEDHPAARRVAVQSHPDLMAIERTAGDKGKLRTQIVIEDVRRSVAFFGSTAGEGGWRIAILDSLDEMNQAGENAILKVLEEPPPRSLLLLISHAPGRVRATLRSRCRRLTLRPLSEDDVTRAAAQALGRSPRDEDISTAASLAEGSVARALSFLDGDALALHRQVMAMLDLMPQTDMQALHALGDTLAGADQRVMDGVIDTINTWLSAELNARKEPRRMAQLAEAADAINRAAREASIYNLERKPLIFQTFSLLAEAARG